MSGLLVDTDIFILAERAQKTLDFSAYTGFTEVYLSAVTASELLVGVHQAKDAGVRARRSAFVESILSSIPILSFDMAVARTHAMLMANVPKNQTVGTHDALIAATALSAGFAVLTRNGKDFRKFAGVAVVDWVAG